MRNSIKNVCGSAGLNWPTGQSLGYGSRDSRRGIPSGCEGPANQLTFLLCLSLLLSGCSAAYNGERLFWKAQQINAPIVKSPQTAAPEQYAKAIQAFQLVAQKTPGTIWAARAHVAVGSLYALEKQYDQARQAYTLVLQNYNPYKDLCLGTRVAVAKTYEIEQNWDEAIKTYRDIAEYHPWTVPGLEALLYVPWLQAHHGSADEATKGYEWAVRQYTQLLLDAPNPETAIQVKARLVLAYQRLGQWDNVTKTLEELRETPGVTNRPLVLLTLGAVYQTKLSNPEKAEGAYTELVKEFPAHPFSKAAKAQLERMGVSAVPIPTVPQAPVATP